MAVSVDTVYQRVLAIANKEQRGYITPQEFNLFANQAQMDLFEQYFYDINQINRVPGNQTEYSNHIDILNEKINLFEMVGDCRKLVDGSTRFSSFKLPEVDNFYRLGTVKHAPVYPNVITDPYFNQALGNNVLTNDASTVTDFGTISNATVFKSSFVASSPGDTDVLFLAANETEYYWFSKISFAGGHALHLATYRVSFEVTNHVGGSIVPIAAVRTSDGLSTRFGVGPEVNEVGTYSFDIELDQLKTAYLNSDIHSSSKTAAFGFLSNASSTTLSIDNISVKQVGSEYSPGGGWRVGGNVKASLTDLNNTYIPNLKLGEVSDERKNRIWGIHADGTTLTTGSTFTFQENFITGSTYRITLNVADATQGKLFLQKALAESFQTHTEEINNGNYDNLTLYSFDKDGDSKFVDLFWTQGGINTNRIEIYKTGGFDGSIKGLSVRLVEDNAAAIEIEHVTEQELTYVLGSKINKPTTTRPVYSRRNNLLNVHPQDIVDGVTCNYIRKPNQVQWGYTEVNGTALYNSSTSSDFELHESEEVNLVFKILKLAGITIEDPQIYSVGAREDMFNIQQEKA
tara:strand:- start:11678 stop:13396 length:1719 start_codon:yes stop_codon:yes gene_type:complete